MRASSGSVTHQDYQNWDRRQDRSRGSVQSNGVWVCTNAMISLARDNPVSPKIGIAGFPTLIMPVI